MPYVLEPAFSPRRLITLGVVGLLHVFLIIALKNGLVQNVVALIKGPIDVRIIQEEIIPEEAPPPPPIKIETPPPFVPMPEIQVELPPEPPSTTAVAAIVSNAPPPVVVTPSAPSAKAQRISRTGMKLDPNRSPSTDDYYPATSKRLGEEGSTIVGVCVGPDGRVIGPIKLDQTSGSSRLDEAAMKYALRTRWTAATENGKPMQACASLAVRFVLKTS